MIITKIQPSVTRNYTKLANKPVKMDSPCPSGNCNQGQTGLSQDTVSFRGNIVNGINSARKWHDYGDIFHEGVNLAGKELKKAKVKLQQLVGADFSFAQCQKSVFEGCNFTGANLTRATFENGTLEGCILRDVITNDTNFSYSNLYGTIFDGAFGSRTSCQNANLMAANLKNADINKINFSGAVYNRYTEFPMDFEPIENGLINIEEGINLNKNLERMKLRGVHFTDMDLSDARFKRADLKHCTFENCDLTSSDFKRAYVKKAIIDNCDLSNSELKQINMDGALLHNVDMRNTNVRGAILTWGEANNVNLRGATYDQYTVFPAGFDPKANQMRYIESTLAYYGIK